MHPVNIFILRSFMKAQAFKLEQWRISKGYAFLKHLVYLLIDLEWLAIAVNCDNNKQTSTAFLYEE